jgi:hypothetical protein
MPYSQRVRAELVWNSVLEAATLIRIRLGQLLRKLPKQRWRRVQSKRVQPYGQIL